MRFLILSNNYPFTPGTSHLQTELAAELINKGHEVDVILLAWYMPLLDRPGFVRTPEGAAVTIVPVYSIRRFGLLVERISKWLLSPIVVGRTVRKEIDPSHYDVVVAWTPCVLVRNALRHVLRNGRAKSVLFVADFFPIHHAETGLLPGGLFYLLLKRMEGRLIRHFDIIFCNLSSNIEYLRKNYRICAEQDVRWTPLWASLVPIGRRDRQDVRHQYGLPADAPIAVFGGHIMEGRGIEQMLAAAASALADGSPVRFLFIGDGRLVPLIEAAADPVDSNVIHLRNMPRSDYLEILTACDVGLLATVSGVSSHSFPTKSIDYLRAGLPVVASVEAGSEFAAMIVDEQIGVSVKLGDVQGLYRAVESFARDSLFRAAMAGRAQTFLEERLDVRHCYRRLMDALDGKPAV